MQGAGRESSTANEDPRTENDDGEHQGPDTEIYDVTEACFDLFERLLSAAEADYSPEQALLASDSASPDELPRDMRGLRNSFAFWIDYTGALAPVGASLDDRLHGHEEIREIVVELLEMVERNLRRLERTRVENPTLPNAELQRWPSTMDSALDRLHFLGRAIRKASAKRQEQDLFNFVSEEEKLFHSMALSYVKWKCPYARPSLRDHMADFIAGRRRALLQKQQHAKKLRMRRPPKTSPAMRQEQPLTPYAEKAATQMPATGRIPHTQPSIATSRATQASKMDRRAAWQHINQKPTLSIRSSGSLRQGDSTSVEYPDPPPIKPGEKHIQCPYCFEPLAASEMRKATKNEYWKRHVNHDLQPYVCPFRGCTDPFFARQSDWRKHMTATHSQEWPRKVHSLTWYCNLDHKEPIDFDNEAEWREHMRELSLHPSRSKVPTDAQLDALAVRKQILTPREPYVCPFCEDKPQKIADLGDRGNTTDMANILVVHIAEHIKSLSFLSLPGRDGEAAEDDRRSADLKSSSRKRLRNSGSLPQPPSGGNFMEDISLTFNDDDDKPGSQVNQKPPVVVQIDPEYVSNWSDRDVNPTAETEVDQFFTSIPSTESDFSWDFVPPRVAPLSAVDSAFRQWYNHASTSAPRPELHWSVPFGRNRDFVGRREIMDLLLERLPPDVDKDNCQRTAIEGLGGMGKTQMALEAAFRVRDQHPNCSVFWVPAVDITSFENAYREIGQKLQVAGIEEDGADIKSLIQNAMSQESCGNWLLVIDNADDVELLFGTTALCDYLPTSPKGSILFTTRNHEVVTELNIPQRNVIRVKELTDAEAIQILQANLKESQTRDSDSTKALLELLTYLPLAINQASAYMAKTGISTTKYLHHCRSSDQRLIKLLSQENEYEGRYKGMNNAIATTWLVSFNHILRDKPVAADILRSICFLDEKDIPLSLFSQGDDELEVDEAIGTLKAYAFITEREDHHSFDVHRLIQLATRNWLQQEGQQEQWIKKMIQLLADVFPFPVHENRDGWQHYLPHALSAVKFQEHEDGEQVDMYLLFKIAESYTLLGKYWEAESMYRQTLDLREKVLGEDHPDTLASMNNLAAVLLQQGKYEEAEQMQRQTLHLIEKVLGEDHPLTLDSMNNLAIVLRQQGKYEEAEQMQRESLYLREKVLGEDHPDTLASMNNLAAVLLQQGKYEEAEQMQRQTLDLIEKVLGEDHPSTLDSMNNLAEVLRQQGQYEQAAQVQRQTLDLRKKVLGEEHPSTLASMNNLAEVLRQQGQYEQAAQVQRQTLDLRKKVLGEEHPSTLASMNNLAEVLRQQGQYEEAEDLHRQTLDLTRKVLGEEHPSTLASMNNLAAVLQQQGKYEEAEDLHRQTLDLKEKVLREKHPATRRWP